MELETNTTAPLIAILSGAAAGALAALWMVRREMGKLRAHLERTGAVSAPAIPAPAVPGRAAPAPVVASPATPAAVPAALVAPEPAEEISSEILSVIAAVVAAFVGKSARVRSVRRARIAANAWIQQGRVSVQGSHQLQRQ